MKWGRCGSDLSKEEIGVKYVTPALHRAERGEDTRIRRHVSFITGRIICGTSHDVYQSKVAVFKNDFGRRLDQEIQEVKGILGLMGADQK